MRSLDDRIASGCEVAILAGGFGSRLKERSGDLPKPMVPVSGRPALEHLVRSCARQGFHKIALLVHFKHESILEYFGDGKAFGVSLTYCVESVPRGTAGALCDAIPQLDQRVLVLYGDTYADIDLRAVWNHHAASGAAATLFLHPNDHPHDSDLVELDGDGHVVGIFPYPHDEHLAVRNLVNAALYVLETRSLTGFLPIEGRQDIARWLFPAMIDRGLVLRGYLSPEYIKDLGTPERLDKVEAAISSGIPERLSTRTSRRAVILDRDGTINVEVGHLCCPQQLQLIDGAAAAIRALNCAGWLAVGATNQPVLARGEVDLPCLEHIHARLDQLLGLGGAYLDRMYVCPHHPDRGFPGEVAALKVICDCRKPATGLIEQAIRELTVDRDASWMVGNSAADVGAGRGAGLRTILVGHSRKSDLESEPDYAMSTLQEAVEWILHGHEAATRRLQAVCEAARQARLVLMGGDANQTSRAARVLQEMLRAGGCRAHVLSIEGREHWARTWHEMLMPLVDSSHRQALPGFARIVEPGDTIIVEGASALFEELQVSRATVRVFLEENDHDVDQVDALLECQTFRITCS